MLSGIAQKLFKITIFLWWTPIVKLIRSTKRCEYILSYLMSSLVPDPKTIKSMLIIFCGISRRTSQRIHAVWICSLSLSSVHWQPCIMLHDGKRKFNFVADHFIAAWVKRKVNILHYYSGAANHWEETLYHTYECLIICVWKVVYSGLHVIR